jgi:NAD(P)-dependent dehydrogenase (short-subunit alcohol dehydrogenase family)
MNESLAMAPRAALVTGGAQRIGAAVVRALARTGYAVAIHVRHSHTAAASIAAEILAAGGQAAVVTADLAVHAEVENLVPQAVAAIGPLTLLVNNASEFAADEVGHLDRARFERQLAVNLCAPIFLAQAFAAQFGAAQFGTAQWRAASGADAVDAAIVNITDQRVRKPTPLLFSYALSKSALDSATVMLAQALAPRIRVNAVAPGPVLPGPRQQPEDFARQAAAVPLGRGPTPQEIAEAVLYLAAARSVSGETIAVDGGQHIAWRTPDVWGVAE